MQQARGPGLVQWLAMLSFAASACTRVSTPPPPADAAPAPTPSIVAEPTSVPVASTPSPVATPSETAPAASAPASATKVPAPPTSPDPWTTPQDCSKVDASASQRARVLATCKAKEEFRSFVAARQSCKVASDCSVIPGACPFGCFIPTSKAAVSEVTAKLNELGARLDQAGDRCMYRCMAPPPEVCVEGRCSTGAL